MNTLVAVTLMSLSLVVATPRQADACEKHASRSEAVDEGARFPGASIYQLSSFWKDQRGKIRKLSELAGKPRIVAMVFTRCETACPLLVHDLRSLERKLTAEERAGIGVDLFSFDSKREDTASLKAFAQRHGIDDTRWSIFSSSAGAVAELAAALGVQYKELDTGDFIHANVIFLLDDRGEVVAKKEGLGTDDGSFVGTLKKTLARP